MRMRCRGAMASRRCRQSWIEPGQVGKQGGAAGGESAGRGRPAPDQFGRKALTIVSAAITLFHQWGSGSEERLTQAAEPAGVADGLHANRGPDPNRPRGSDRSSAGRPSPRAKARKVWGSTPGRDQAGDGHVGTADRSDGELGQGPSRGWRCVERSGHRASRKGQGKAELPLPARWGQLALHPLQKGKSHPCDLQVRRIQSRRQYLVVRRIHLAIRAGRADLHLVRG